MITYTLIGLAVCTVYQNKFIPASESASVATIAGNLIGAAFITLIWPVALIKIISSKK